MLKNLALCLLTAGSLLAKNPQQNHTDSKNSAVIPTLRNEAGWWKKRHKQKSKLAAENKYDLIFIGDSITHGFEGGGKKVWKKYYAPRKALNLGFSGDRTEHVIWRLDHGELKNQKDAKVVVLMIGTNNTGQLQQDAHETAAGVKKILFQLKEKTPQAEILLLAVFPRSAKPDDKLRRINTALNKKIATYADAEHVHFLNINKAFLDENGTLSKKIMPDLLHPKQKGYGIWTRAIEPKLKEFGL